MIARLLAALHALRTPPRSCRCEAGTCMRAPQFVVRLDGRVIRAAVQRDNRARGVR